MKKTRRWKMVALAAVFLYLVLKMWCGDWNGVEEQATDLQDQIWLERLPGDQRDKVQGMFFSKIEGQRYGAMGKSSIYRWEIDVIEWKLDGDTLVIDRLQDEKTEKHKIRVWRCEKEAPRPFQLCLQFDKGSVFYSRDDWKVGSLPSDAPEIVRTLVRGHR